LISIEQVRLLGTRVEQIIEHVDSVSEENAALKSKLDACQKRIDELEVLIQRFKEDQAKIEDGILSALDRLNKFEDEMDKGLSRAKSSAIPDDSDSSGGLVSKASAVETDPEGADEEDADEEGEEGGDADPEKDDLF